MAKSSDDPVHPRGPARLLLMRHAKAAYPDHCSDHERPLAGRGRKDAPLVGRWLTEVAWVPQLVVCSDAARALETAQLVVTGLEARKPPPIELSAELYEADVDTMLQVIAQTSAKVGTLLIVGHEPIMSATTGAICGKYAHFPTSTVAQIELENGYAGVGPETGRLVAVRSPKD